MDASDIEIREATIADALMLSELGRRTFRDAFDADISDKDMAAYLGEAFGVEIQTRELDEPSSVFLVAQVKGTAVGYSRLGLGNTHRCVAGVRPMEIVRFYSDSFWIGRGVGPALMKASLEQAATRQCDRVWLAVWERNTRAIAFYSRWGFDVVGEADFALGEDVQHDLVMARPVSHVGHSADRTR